MIEQFGRSSSLLLCPLWRPPFRVGGSSKVSGSGDPRQRCKKCIVDLCNLQVVLAPVDLVLHGIYSLGNQGSPESTTTT